jgi:hypothetical protein
MLPSAASHGAPRVLWGAEDNFHKMISKEKALLRRTSLGISQGLSGITNPSA